MVSTLVVASSWDIIGTPSPIDVRFYLSGGASNTDPAASIGGAISTTEVSGTALNNLFDNVAAAESTAGDVEYRCFYIKNVGETTWDTPDLWILQATPSDDSAAAIGLDPAGVNGTAATPADESTAPSGVSFSSPVTKGTGLALGSLTENAYQAVWVRRTITAGATAYTSDNLILSFED